MNHKYYVSYVMVDAWYGNGIKQSDATIVVMPAPITTLGTIKELEGDLYQRWRQDFDAFEYGGWRLVLTAFSSMGETDEPPTFSV